MELGLVRRIDIDTEMQQAYLDYAMSVIVARALPDARDGLKPVHRRILYAMYDMGMRPESPYKKSARIVGEVLGKYHPHGDMAVYEAMARMAQDFSMRCMLVDGQGNFGSVDGDPPAAMRYTEARLTAPAIHMLADIQKNTVDFEANFDGSLSEPAVLPAALPNLLVNGATGIAVGMSTSIPPHNLAEVIDALKYLLENWERMDDIGLEDLMRFIQGPDFPTGGVIIQENGEGSLASAYGSGRGRVTVQARAHLEEMERGRNRIIVNELPYMTNKSSLIERIAELARDGKLEGLADLRDESDRQGMRIVIELVKTADPEAVLRDLYKHTPMQSTFSLIMLALVDGEPRMLTLKQALRVYLDHRLEIVRRRSQYDLEKARQRAHILEGYRVALKNLDEVIDMIRKAPDAETARSRLMKRFKLSEIQAGAILDLQLRRLAALERKKIEEEYKEVLALIKELEGLLHSPKKMRQTVAEELQAVKEVYGDRRRTQIVHMKVGEEKRAMLTIGDLAPEKTAWLVVTAEGLVSRTLEDKLPRQSGNDAPAWLLRVNTRDTLYLASEGGDTAAVPVLAVPETDQPSDGIPFARLSALTDTDKLAAMFTLPPKGDRAEDWYVLTATRQGMLKKTAVGELPGPAANTFTLVRVNQGDRLGWLRLTDGKAEVLLLTAGGMAIRFNEEEVRPMGLVAAGVMGMKLQKGDEVVGMEVLPQAGEVFMLAMDGSAKRVPIAQFPKQGRYGQGVVTWKLPPKSRAIGLVVGKGTQRVTLHLSKLAPKVVRLDEAPLQTRAARGGRIQSLKAGELVSLLTVPWDWERPLVASKRTARVSTKMSDEESVEVAAKGRARATAARAGAEPEGAGRKKGSRAATGVASEDGVKMVTPSSDGAKKVSPPLDGAKKVSRTTAKVRAKEYVQSSLELDVKGAGKEITKAATKAAPKTATKATTQVAPKAATKVARKASAKTVAKGTKTTGAKEPASQAVGTDKSTSSTMAKKAQPAAGSSKVTKTKTSAASKSGRRAKPASSASTRSKSGAAKASGSAAKAVTKKPAVKGGSTRSRSAQVPPDAKPTKTGTRKQPARPSSSTAQPPSRRGRKPKPPA